MAEETNDILVTPERTVSEDSNLRNSTGKTSTSSGREKILPPHYLRASTGSCHDFCKYGRKHTIEAKVKHRIRRRVAITVTKDEYSINGATVSERKKKSAVSLRPSPDSETYLPNNNSEIIKLEVPSSDKIKECFSKEALSPTRQIEVSSSEASPPAREIEVSPKHALSPAKEIEVSPKHALSPAKEIEVSPKHALSPAKKIEVSPKQAVSPAKKIKVPPKRAVSSAKKIEVPPKQGVSASKKIGVSPKQAVSPADKIEASPKRAGSPADKIEASPKRAVSPADKIEASPKRAVSPAKKIEVSPKQAVKPAKKLEVCPKQAVSPAKKIEASPKQALVPSRKIEASTKQISSPAKRNNASVKPGSPLKPTSIATKPCSPSGLSGGMRGKRNTDLKIVKKMPTSEIDEKKKLRPSIASVSPKPSLSRDLSLNTKKYKIGEKKALRPPVAYVSPKPSISRVLSLNTKKYKIGEKKALRPPVAYVSPKPSISRVLSLNTRKYRSVKAVSALKNQNKVKKAKPKLANSVKEKTLYVIEQSESKSLEVAQNGTHITESSPSSLLYSHVEEENEESDSVLSEADSSISEYEEMENGKQSETLNMEDKKSGRRSVHPEKKGCPPQKLNFRRGSVVNLQSENNAPRKLRFRQGRVAENNGKGDIGRRSFRRRRGVTDGDTGSTKPESQKVVLRHQDVQGKKDAQGLFNNVIEETASKLVVARKSKVKALVGAFETVISLQEGKPSTTESFN